MLVEFGRGWMIILHIIYLDKHLIYLGNHAKLVVALIYRSSAAVTGT